MLFSIINNKNDSGSTKIRPIGNGWVRGSNNVLGHGFSTHNYCFYPKETITYGNYMLAKATYCYFWITHNEKNINVYSLIGESLRQIL